MNKNLTIAVGAAAAVAMGGVAFASNINTINASEAYISGAGANFLPMFITEECDALAGGTSTNTGANTGSNTTASGGTGACANHGHEVLAMGASNALLGLPYVPAFDNTPNSGIVLSSSDVAFDNGLFARTTAAGGANYFSQLDNAWTSTYSQGANASNSYQPMGVQATATGRDEWIDQTVVGYVVSKNTPPFGATTLGGDSLRQNFRSQLSWAGTDVALADAQIDQRLEQTVALGQAAFEARLQTLQSAIAITSNSNATVTSLVGDGAATNIAQLVSQDVEGYLFSCMNCDSNNVPTAHRFAPADISVSFQPYHTAWHGVPSIVHAPN